MLHLPPSVSISRFVGGYKSISSYTDLHDTETNQAANVTYSPKGDLDKRQGSERLRNLRLANTATPTVGEPITGLFFFDKLGNANNYQVVCAGNSIYSYTSATTTIGTTAVLRTGLTDDSNTFFTFAQIQDPRAPADDIILMSNGVDPIQVWNGTATAVTLGSFTSSTSVLSASASSVTAKYILGHKRFIYAANILDTTDVNAAVRVLVSEFGGDGNPNPHRFTNAFYLGSTGRQGDIRGLRVLNDQIILYTRKGVWKFYPGSSNVIDTTSNLIEMQEAHGVLAPRSLVEVGNFHVFLSENGVFAFDGNTFTHISEKVDDELLNNSNKSQIQYACAVFNRRDNQYVLYYPDAGSTKNNKALVYDLRLKVWQPPITGRNVCTLGTFDASDGIERVLYGDYYGYLYEDYKGTNDGLTAGFNGTATGATVSTLSDTTAAFPTANDGLSGLTVTITGGTGSGQQRVITSNTATVLTVELQFSPTPDTTSTYSVAAIDGYWRSKDYDFVGQDLVKLFRTIRLRAKESGNFNMSVFHIVDFRELRNATENVISLLDSGFAWDNGRWDQVRWGAKDTVRRKINLRSTATQPCNGTHLAVQFRNSRANETFRISGFDVEMKAIGKR